MKLTLKQKGFESKLILKVLTQKGNKAPLKSTIDISIIVNLHLKRVFRNKNAMSEPTRVHVRGALPSHLRSSGNYKMWCVGKETHDTTILPPSQNDFPLQCRADLSLLFC